VWADYLIKRLVRLWIVLVPAIFIVILIDTIGFQFLAQAGSIYSAPAGQQYLKAEFFDQGHDILIILGNFLQNIFVPTIGTNIPLWSLSYEFWYYLLFPLVLLTVQPNADLFRRIAYGFSALGIAVVIGGHADYLFLIWILGAAVSSLPRRIRPRLARWAVLIVLMAFLIVFVTAKKFNLHHYAGEMIIASLSGLLIYGDKVPPSASCRSTAKCHAFCRAFPIRFTSPICLF
jgi:peptidoglycan/LPS O-acetylase OafA/YrhL